MTKTLTPEEIDAIFRERMAERQKGIERAIAHARAEGIRKLDLPERCLQAFRAGVQETPAIAALTGFGDTGGGLVILSGNPGCGKTVAAARWLFAPMNDLENWACENEINPRFIGGAFVFVTAARLARWERYDDQAMRKLLKASRLVVDDMGTEYLDDKGVYLSTLDEVVNERHSAMRPTVLTTNLSANAFKERYGARVADRVREGGKFVSLTDKSMRGKP